MHPADDPGWSGYASTILEVHGDSVAEVPLHRPIGMRERQIFAAAGLPDTFGIMTAENPFGRTLDPAGNAERRASLEAELAARGEHPVRIDGLSPDRQHREIGVGLPWSREDVVDLGRRWDQSAIYWFDGTHMWVIGALTAAPPWRLEPQ